MASDYGLNFGFRRSDESVRTSEGRLRTPATGPTLLIGTMVEQDPTNLGFVRVAAANTGMRPGTAGLLVQEEVWDRRLYEQQRVDSFVLGFARPNRLSVITTGAGTKVWFRNTPTKNRADGRVIPAVSMYIATNVAVGRGLAWNGTQFVDVASPTDPTAVMEVTFFDSTSLLLEAVFTH